MIIFNAIRRADHFDVLKAWYCAHHWFLCFLRYAAGDPIRIYDILSNDESCNRSAKWEITYLNHTPPAQETHCVALLSEIVVFSILAKDNSVDLFI